MGMVSSKSKLATEHRTATEAGRVFAWLEAVGPISDLDTEHVLACWYRERPDTEAGRKHARALAAVWLKKHTDDSVDRYLVFLVQAEASRGTTKCAARSIARRLHRFR